LIHYGQKCVTSVQKIFTHFTRFWKVVPFIFQLPPLRMRIPLSPLI